jgi:class 3 adenylate cyclase
LLLLDEYSEHHTSILKIKTVGFSVLYVSGINGDNDTKDAVQWGLEVLRRVKEFNEYSGSSFRPRIGIAVGPLVAGVISSKRPKFDIWGDTVNTASRMEMFGVENSIHITEDTKPFIEESYGILDNLRFNANTEVADHGPL